MKRFFLFAVLAFFSLSSFAQSFGSGTKVGSIGVGLGGSYSVLHGSRSTPAISLQYEQGIWPIEDIGTISLGGYLGFKSFSYNGTNYSQSWNYVVIGARSAFHYSGFNIKEWDPYAGLMLSYNYLNYHYNGPNAQLVNGNYNSVVGFSGYLGSRYYFTPQLAGFAELGFGISYLTVGVALKF